MGPLDPSRLGAFLMRQIPPSDGEVVERGNVLPLGTYRTPDGRETTTLAFPQPMREGLDALAYALGYRQDPNAPAGYVTHDALNKGGQGLAESAMVGSLGARAPAGALRSGMAKPDLDPSQAARMARAREMGFDTDQVLYHGTPAEFDAFKGHQRTGATWLTDDPNIASQYAMSAHRARDIEGTGPKNIPVYVRGKTLNVTDRGPDGSHGWQSDNIADALGFKGKTRLNFKNVIDEARKQGYGVIRVDDMTDIGGQQTQYMVLDPRNIRSVNAMFDPAKSDSANLLAANPLAGAVPLAWKQPQQQQGPMMGEQMGRRIPPEEEAQRQALIRYLQGVQ